MGGGRGPVGTFITESSAVGPPVGAKGETQVVSKKLIEVHHTLHGLDTCSSSLVLETLILLPQDSWPQPEWASPPTQHIPNPSRSSPTPMLPSL